MYRAGKLAKQKSSCLQFFFFTDYVDDLISLVLDEVFEDPGPYVEQLKEIPIPMDLASRFERPLKEEMTEHHVSFIEVVVGSQHADQPDQETPSISGEQYAMG